MTKKVLSLLAVIALMACSATEERYQSEEVPEQMTQSGYESDTNSDKYLNVIEITEGSFDTARLLSAEVMASTLKDTIYDVFGANIQGFYVEMALVEPRFDWRIFWVGKVAETKEDLDSGNYLYSFRFSSHDGSGLDLFREYAVVSDESIEDLSEENLEAYKAHILNSADRFSGVYWPRGDFAHAVSIERIESADLRANELKFNLSLLMGQEIEVVYQRGTNKILSFQTFYRPSGVGIG